MPSKAELRIDALALRRSFAHGLSSNLRAALEHQLRDHVLPRLGDVSTIAAYHAMRDEIDPAPIVRELVRMGWIVALPWFADRSAPMIFREAPATEPGPWGVHQPHRPAAAVVPEIVLVPLVAADVRGNRIGHGQGHYDRALARLRAPGALRTIGLAWDVQIVDGDLPVDPWDVPLDAIATPRRWIARIDEGTH